jgi:hypothetical protein
MSWEAFRLSSRTPAEVLHVLGPHGVDELIRKMMDACWREYPEAERSFEAVRQRVIDVYERNMRHWSTIRKPAPAAYFDNLLPYAADGHMRQALVLTWMMMPRAGGRNFSDVKKIVARIFQRNLDAWDQDYLTFTSAGTKPTKRKGATAANKAATARSKRPKPARKKTTSTPRRGKR